MLPESHVKEILVKRVKGKVVIFEDDLEGIYFELDGLVAGRTRGGGDGKFQFILAGIA